jgi:tRNA(Ile)-lysidine synthase
VGEVQGNRPLNPPSAEGALLPALRTALAVSLATEPAPWLLAYSAGLDSTVLMHALRHSFPALELHALHVHHGLQPGADAWAQAAHREANALGLRFAVTHLVPPSRFPEGTEAWARTERWRALEGYAKANGIRSVLLAHHQQDQAETLLINLIRGTGVDGLRAMPSVLQRAGLRWLRPLLGVPKSVLVEQAQRWQLAWVDDPSNTQPAMLRNRVRLQVLPLLEEIRPGAVKRIAALAGDLGRLRLRDALQGDDLAAPVLAQKAGAAFEARESDRGGKREGDCAALVDDNPIEAGEEVALDLATLKDCAGEAQRAALHDWVKRVTGRGPSRARLNELHALCFIARSAQGYLRHGSFVLRRRGGRLHCEVLLRP